MLANGQEDIDRCVIIPIAEYRKRQPCGSDKPPGPPGIAGRKSCDDTLLASWIVADSASRLGKPGVNFAHRRCVGF